MPSSSEAHAAASPASPEAHAAASRASHEAGVAAPSASGAGRPSDARSVVAAFLTAVESRDAAAVAQCFAPDATYQNVPHPPAEGRAAIEALFAPILGRSERVVWDIVSESYAERRAWLERVDRFWIAGTEYRIECNGVAEIDPAAGLLTAFRDYVDLGVWRARLAAAPPD